MHKRVSVANPEQSVELHHSSVLFCDLVKIRHIILSRREKEQVAGEERW